MPEVKCHYEVLGVSQDVGDDELKKSYRKLALKWHPDKNPEKVEECTKYFAVIQRAYDVLSDKQERAWYDKHREAILKGGFGGDYEDDFLDVMQYMSPAAYTGFGDDDEGFYAVYREVFHTIAEEDIRYMDDDDPDAEGIPGFGDSQSDYKEVGHEFYAYWQSYCTARSFVWVEKYDVRDAPNRRTARLIEKENKKKREAARKAWNQQVQLLVSYVRKKDKRVLAHKKMMEEKAAERKRLEAERREKDRKERAKMHEELAAQGQAAREEMDKHLREMEAALNEEYGVDSDQESYDSQDESLEEDLNDLFCVACNKSFKSPKAFANHENSKKHKENMAILKAEMQAEEEEYAGENSEEEEDVEEEDGEDNLKEEEEEEEPEEGLDLDEKELELDEENEEVDEIKQKQEKKKMSKKQKKKRRQQGMSMEEEDVDLGLIEEEEEEDAPEEDSPLKTKLSKKQKKKRRQQAAAQDTELSIAEELERLQGKQDEEEEDFSKSKLSKKQKKKRRQQRQTNGDEPDNDKGVENEANGHGDPEGESQPEVTEEEKLAADVQERLSLNDETKTAPSRKSAKSSKSQDNSEASDEPNFCHTCSSHFQSRNKLFKHIKNTGHALRLSDNTPASSQSQTSSKGGKKKKKHKGRSEIE